MQLKICLKLRQEKGKGEAEVGSIISKRKITDTLTHMENPLRSISKSLPKTRKASKTNITCLITLRIYLFFFFSPPFFFPVVEL